MSDGTKIEWTDATWNPITGCSVVSPGCTNCYAMTLAGTRLKHHPTRAGLTRESKAGPVWTGEVRFNATVLDQPLRWRRPRMIFVCAHGDLFAEGVPDMWIDKIFAVMALAPQHTFQVLTKRPERMRAYFADTEEERRCGKITAEIAKILPNSPFRRVRMSEVIAGPLRNVWLGVSVEDQRRANERVPVLLDTPAALLWISGEPLLGPLTVVQIPREPNAQDRAMPGFAKVTSFWINALNGCEGITYPDGLGGVMELERSEPKHRALGWIVAGGESGHGARPMHPDWARSLRDQCAVAGVPFLFKQWGAWAHSEQVPPPVPGPSFFDGEGTPTGDSWRFWTEGDRGANASIRVGKKAAGRLLDGVTHDGFPGVAA